MDNRDMTTLCGLWCGDCVPANDRLFALTAELETLLKEIQFEEYAEYKSATVPEFKDYVVFATVLDAFKKIHCRNYCRNGPVSIAASSPTCKIRMCALEKELDGCWDCDTYATCDMLIRLSNLHPAVMDNLAALKEHGIENWLEHKGKNYRWSK